MDGRLLPLLLASDTSAVREETEPLDRVRLQKGVFLLMMRGPAGWKDLYSFTPYDWGPYSFSLASIIEELVAAGYLEKEAFPGRRYLRYRTTRTGEDLLGDIASKMTGQERAFVKEVRRYVNSRPFARLLREVYKAYPEFAVNSRFSG